MGQTIKFCLPHLRPPNSIWFDAVALYWQQLHTGTASVNHRTGDVKNICWWTHEQAYYFNGYFSGKPRL